MLQDLPLRALRVALYIKSAPCIVTLRVHRCRRIAGSSPSPYRGLVAVGLLRVRRCRHIAGSSLLSYCGFVAVAVLRVRRCGRIASSSLSPYCEFVAVAILRVRRCRRIAGLSLSPYCGFVAVAVLRVCRCRRIAGSSLQPYSCIADLSISQCNEFFAGFVSRLFGTAAMLGVFVKAILFVFVNVQLRNLYHNFHVDGMQVKIYVVKISYQSNSLCKCTIVKSTLF